MRTSLVSLLALSFCSSAIAAGPTAKPNIVVFIEDDQAVLDTEPYGATDVRTPNMAKLAKEGLKFTQCYAASPSCGPSRTAMLTGLWPARNGAEPNHMPKRPDVAGLPTVLHALGYEVAAIGKVAHNDYAKYYDFDFVAGKMLGEVDTKVVEKFLTSRDKSKPLCLFFGTRHPHTPWLKNKGYDPAKLQLPPSFVDTKETREQRANYYTSVTAADTLLGEVRALADQNIPGDTLFVWTGDNGSAWPFSKWDLYDAGTHLPFVMVWPNHLKPGTTTDAKICLPDLLPTFIELAGGKVPEGLDGKSFAGVMLGTGSTHRDSIFTTCSGDGDHNVYPSRSLRTQDWRYILNLHPEFQHHTHISRSAHAELFWNSWLAAAETSPAAAAIVKRYIERPADELYDLKKDPFQLNNLAADPNQAERLSTMRSAVRSWMKAQGDKETVFNKPLLIGEPVTIIGGDKKKKKNAPAEAGGE